MASCSTTFHWGQGIIDLKRMVEFIRKVKRKVRFLLELIRRDPLKVPSLTDEELATMGKSLVRDPPRSSKVNLKDRCQHVVFEGGHEIDDASTGVFAKSTCNSSLPE